MPITEPNAALAPVLNLLFEGGERGAWRKCIVTPARQAAAFVPWDKLIAQPVRLNRGLTIKVVTRSGKKEATSTLTPAQWRSRLQEAIELGPCHLDVLAADHDWHARRTRDGRWLVTKGRPSLAGPPVAEPAAHDRSRQHPLSPEDPDVQQLFIDTGLFAKNGQLLGDRAAKYRQVQHYIELVRHLPVWAEGQTVNVLDAGCGKAYLSLALCLWAEKNGSLVRLTGVDASEDVVESVRAIAAKMDLDATFHAMAIADFASNEHAGPVDVLVSLHACDTATDEALAAGVRLGAKAIVLVPCCHHELVAQMETNNNSGSAPAAIPWKAALRSGLLTHRLADIVTDSLRAAALEALGYRVDVLEFVTPEATAKNLMLRAVRTAEQPNQASRAALQRYQDLASEWSVRPSLEAFLGELWPPQE